MVVFQYTISAKTRQRDLFKTNKRIWLPGNLCLKSSTVEFHYTSLIHYRSLPRHHEKCYLPLLADQCHSDRSIHSTQQTNFHFVGTLLGLKREHTWEVENSAVVIQSRRTQQMKHFQCFVVVVNYFQLMADLGKGYQKPVHGCYQE